MANYVLRLIRFYDHINTITEMGCVLKDVDLGLTDFLSFREGERCIYACGSEKVE